MNLTEFLPAVIVGFIITNILTHPDSLIWNNLPELKISRFQLMPSIKIYTSSRTVHFHHWFNFTLLLISSAFISSTILDHVFTRGLLVGGILQGLSIRESRRVIYQRPRKI